MDEEGQMRREIEDEVCELRDMFEQENGERMATHEREVSEWKTYEKARVNFFLCYFWCVNYLTFGMLSTCMYFQPIIPPPNQSDEVGVSAPVKLIY